MTSWLTEMNYSATEVEFNEHCTSKYGELNALFTQKHEEGSLTDWEYNLCIIWGTQPNYSIRREYQWKF